VAATKNRITRISAYGLITNADQILLCRLSAQLPHLQGQWTLPGGGLEFREDPADAMVREVREETGLIVKPGELADINSNAIDTPDTEYHGIRILYHAEVIGGELMDEQNGTTDMCGWHPHSELAGLPIVDLVLSGCDILWPEDHWA